MVSLLLKCGENIKARDHLGRSPILQAAKKDSFNCVRLLVESGADCHFKDWEGRGLLHCCAMNTRMTILEYRLESKIGPGSNTQSNIGHAILHDAVSQNSEAVVRLLLELGARIDIRNAQGKTPLQLAGKKNANNVSNQLRKDGLKEMILPA